MKMIYFRVDGNSDIATGHIMRCLAIARACIQAEKQQGQCIQISFLVSDEQSLSLLRDRFEVTEEFTIYVLNSDYRNMEAEVPALLSQITRAATSDQELFVNANCDAPWVFVDSYFVTPNYFDMLRPYCKLAYLDDLRSFECPVELIINYDTDQDCSCYASAAHKLLGIQYTPLRAQFFSPDYHVRPEAEHVLLSTGGTDPYGIAEYLLHIIFDCQSYSSKYFQNNMSHDTGAFPTEQADIDRLRSLQYHIVTSRANTRYDSLTALSKANSHIHIHENVKNMASLMASCDMAVSAGGTTLSELCAVGVPTISYLMADNQRTAVETLAAKGIIPCAGDIRPSRTFDNRDIYPFQTFARKCVEEAINFPPASVICNILDYMTYMSYNVKARQKSSHAMRAFLDGRGAERIADTLLSL